MKGIVMMALLALGTGPVWGQTVIFKCKNAKGAVIYQTEPCERGQKTDSAKVYGPVRYDPQLAAETRRTQQEVDQRRAAYGSQAQAAIIPRDRGASACEAAKAHRESVLKAAGMSRNFNLLRALDEDVRRACK